MKKLATITLTIILMALLSSSLFAAGIKETAVLRLTAYIPERTTFSADEFGFQVASNAHNFTYSVFEQGMDRTLFVVAN
jgi:hypothetical protein